MWYRVEFNRDSSVKSVDCVSARDTGSTLVCYVEAETDSGAITAASDWRRHYLQRARKNRARFVEKRLATGICLECARDAEPGQQLCFAHAKRNVHTWQKWNAGEGTGVQNGALTGPGEEGMVLRQMRSELPLLERIVERYNINRSGFGVWLKEELRRRRVALGVLGKKAS